MLHQPGIPTHSPTSTSWKVSNAALQDSSQGTTTPQAVYRKWFPTSDGKPCTKDAQRQRWWWWTGLHTVLLTSQLHLFFIQPLSGHEGTPCATYNHSVEPTIIGAPSFHQGYAFGTIYQSVSSQRQPWRPSREGCQVTTRYNWGMFLSVFKSLLPVFNLASDAPCKYSVR